MLVRHKAGVMSVVAVTVALAGCASVEDFATNPEKQKTRQGTAIGAAGGAAIGLIAGGGWKGALIGAGVGARPAGGPQRPLAPPGGSPRLLPPRLVCRGHRQDRPLHRLADRARAEGGAGRGRADRTAGSPAAGARLPVRDVGHHRHRGVGRGRLSAVEGVARPARLRQPGALRAAGLGAPPGPARAGPGSAGARPRSSDGPSDSA